MFASQIRKEWLRLMSQRYLPANLRKKDRRKKSGEHTLTRRRRSDESSGISRRDKHWKTEGLITAQTVPLTSKSQRGNRNLALGNLELETWARKEIDRDSEIWTETRSHLKLDLQHLDPGTWTGRLKLRLGNLIRTSFNAATRASKCLLFLARISALAWIKT